MEGIVDQLNNPAWWFNHFFPAAILLVIAKMWTKLPKFLKSTIRQSVYKRTLQIKNLRRQPLSIQYQIGIDQSYFLIFTITTLIYLVLLFVSPLETIFKQSFFVGIMLSAPIYAAEIAWLKKRDFVKDLITSAEKIRIRDHSKG